MLELLKDWRAAGSSRLDRDLDGMIDDPGAAIMDKAWPKIADAVMSPVLGPQLDDLASLLSRGQRAEQPGLGLRRGLVRLCRQGPADARRPARRPGKFKTRFCGNGDLAACRDSLWAAIDAAGNELEADRAPNPDALARGRHGRAHHVPRPASCRDTMRWTNRPTFQQAISYSGHR